MKKRRARLLDRIDIHSRDPRLQHHLLYFAPEIIPTLTVAVIYKGRRED